MVGRIFIYVDKKVKRVEWSKWSSEDWILPTTQYTLIYLIIMEIVCLPVTETTSPSTSLFLRWIMSHSPLSFRYILIVRKILLYHPYCWPRLHTNKMHLYLYIQPNSGERKGHDHVTLILILFRHPSLSSIASGRSSGLHPVSPQSCCM